MDLDRGSIGRRISVKFGHLLHLELDLILPRPPQGEQIESEIPDRPKSKYAPRDGWRGEPNHDIRRLRGKIAVRRQPGRDDWVSAADCENDGTEDTEERVEGGLLSPPFSAAEPEIQHPNRDGESEDGDDGVGVEIDENAVGVDGREMDRHEDHEDGKDPMKEERPKGRFLGVLSRVEPWLLQ